jgi:hypothetical protein
VIPPFEARGFLPPGIHWVDWAEITARFSSNAHRAKLLKGLRKALENLHKAGCRVVYLDGSFITLKDFPNDYDACWEIESTDLSRLDPVFLDFSNRRAAQKTKYFGEFFPAHAKAEASPPYRAFLSFFQTDKETGLPKGIIGLRLQENFHD